MAKPASSFLGMLLAALMAAVPLFAQADSPMSAMPERPAGCHQHRTAPMPRPVSYRCCQSGYDSAILQVPSPSQPQPADVTSHIEPIDAPLPNTIRQNLQDLATSSTDPPDITPLRV